MQDACDVVCYIARDGVGYYSVLAPRKQLETTQIGVLSLVVHRDRCEEPTGPGRYSQRANDIRTKQK